MLSLLLVLLLSILIPFVSATKPGFLYYSDVTDGKTPYTVTYDNRSLFIAGERTFLHSAGIHYPRFTPGQWDDIILKAKNDGYNMIQTYVFVNAHHPKSSVYPWIMEGPTDLHLFIKKIAAAGLFVNFRIGPYVCAEWSWGGYPYDLAQVPGLVSRSHNPAWENWMTTVLLNVTREFRYAFADRGGPIVLAQVENELHTNEQDYVDFCGQLVEETGTAIPWEMCNGNSASNTINSCNSGDCTGFIEENGQNGKVLITQPSLWTEAWMGWFSSWGDNGPAGNWPSFDSTGSATGKSAGFLRWFARGGCHINQYNWAGGNHFARNAGSSMVGIYYWDAPIASDNLAQGPERAHISSTFKALAGVASQILASPAQNKRQVEVPFYPSSGGALAHPDPGHIVYVYPGATDLGFLENHNSSTAIFVWQGTNFTVDPGTVVLAWANGTVLFDSGDVAPFPYKRAWTPEPNSLGAPTTFSVWQDPVVPSTPAGIPTPTAPRTPWVGSALGAVVTSPSPLEAVAFGEYDSELTYYLQTLSPATLAAAMAGAGANGTGAVTLSLASAVAQAWTVFYNGVLVGEGFELSHADGSRRITFPINLTGATAPGVLTLLSTSLGIGNGGGINNGSSTGVKGITSKAPGSVTLGGVDLTALAPWTHVAGSAGEALNIPATPSKVPWTPIPSGVVSLPPLTWVRIPFTAPTRVLAPPPILGTLEVNATLNLDVSGLSRGRFFVNGFDLGRFWTKLCGTQFMCQRFYPIPFDLLLPGVNANTLVILDELGVSNISQVGFAVSENLPPPPPPPCGAPPASGGPAGTFPCGSTYTSLKATSTTGSGVTLQLANQPSLCMGVAVVGGGGGHFVEVQTCNATDPTQVWGIPEVGSSGKVTNAASSACLDVFGQNSSVGAPLDLWGCNGGSNQVWQWDGAQLKSKLTNGELCAGICVY